MLFISGRLDIESDPFDAEARAAEGIAEAIDGAWAGPRAQDRFDGGYGFLAPDCAEGPEPQAADVADAPRRLDALALALAETESDPEEAGSGIPMAALLMLRFIDNDLSAPAWRSDQAALAAGAAASPLPRERVEAEFINLKRGVLALDSLYVCDLAGGDLGAKLTRMMREPDAGARLRLDRGWRDGRPGAPRPSDGGADVLRLGRLMGEDPVRNVTEEEIDALSPKERERLQLDGRADRSRAVTGESRNDLSLSLSQMHAALARFHNRIVDWLVETGRPPERLFAEASALARHHVQWLLLNDLLPRYCDPEVLSRVRRARAPIYAEFLSARGVGRGARRLPIPIEYAFAVSRLHPAMIPSKLALNAVHGPADGSVLARIARPPAGGDRPERMPESLSPDWSLWLRTQGGGDLARLDTQLTPPRQRGASTAMLGYARAALRRGWAFGLPSGQQAAAAVNAVYDDLARPLGEAALTAGHTGEAVRDGLVERTPLWFYLLKEAEVQQGGRRLGQLGSALMAETLLGVLEGDADSVVHARGPRGEAWTPEHGLRLPDGFVEDLDGLFRAADLI